jgi:hypothetical protein
VSTNTVCPSCREPLNPATRFCPRCGRPALRADRFTTTANRIVLAVGLAGGLVVYCASVAQTAASAAEQESARLAAREEAQQARANALIPTLSPKSVRQLPDSDLEVLWNLGPGISPRAETLPRGAWWSWVDRESRRRQPAPVKSSRQLSSRCLLADGRAAPGYALLVANIWEGQRLYRTTTCDYVAKVLGVDKDGDVVLRTVADGDVVTLPRKLVQAQFVTDAR